MRRKNVCSYCRTDLDHFSHKMSCSLYKNRCNRCTYDRYDNKMNTCDSCAESQRERERKSPPSLKRLRDTLCSWDRGQAKTSELFDAIDEANKEIAKESGGESLASRLRRESSNYRDDLQPGIKIAADLIEQWKEK